MYVQYIMVHDLTVSKVLICKPSPEPSLVLNNEYAENDIHKANMLNNYFAS